MILHAERVMDEADALALWKSDAMPPAMDATIRPDDEDPIEIRVAGEPEVVIARYRGDIGPLRRALLAYPCGAGVVRSAGIRTRSQVFGYLGHNPVLQRNTCMVSTGAVHHPRAHAEICGAAERLGGLLHEIVPNQWDRNRRAVGDVLDDWLLPGGLWTSGVVNNTSQFPYHRDRNNFDAWSAMPVVRRHVRGGHLHFPELAVDGAPVVAACGDGDVIFFNGQRWMHGVTPLRRLRPDGYRISAVYYPVRAMARCLPAEEEFAAAARRRTEIEDTLLDRQRADGILTD